jgi:hypothetical protein
MRSASERARATLSRTRDEPGLRRRVLEERDGIAARLVQTGGRCGRRGLRLSLLLSSRTYQGVVDVPISGKLRTHRFRVGLGFGPQLIGEILSLCQDFSGLPRDLDPSRLDYLPRSMIEHPYMILPCLWHRNLGVPQSHALIETLVHRFLSDTW